MPLGLLFSSSIMHATVVHCFDLLLSQLYYVVNSFTFIIISSCIWVFSNRLLLLDSAHVFVFALVKYVLQLRLRFAIVGAIPLDEVSVLDVDGANLEVGFNHRATTSKNKSKSGDLGS